MQRVCQAQSIPIRNEDPPEVREAMQILIRGIYRARQIEHDRQARAATGGEEEEGEDHR